MRVDPQATIATIAVDVPASRELFESMGIDYACGGPRSLVEAAHEAGLDPEVVMAGLRRLPAVVKPETWRERPVGALVEYLIEQHDHLVRDELSSIAFALFRLRDDRQGPVPGLESLRAALYRLSEALLRHNRAEEIGVFAAVGKDTGDGLREAIARAVTEHGALGVRLRTIRELRLAMEASLETPPECDEVLDAVARLEAHVHECMFLENCILFPRALGA